MHAAPCRVHSGPASHVRQGLTKSELERGIVAAGGGPGEGTCRTPCWRLWRTLRPGARSATAWAAQRWMHGVAWRSRPER